MEHLKKREMGRTPSPKIIEKRNVLGILIVKLGQKRPYFGRGKEGLQIEAFFFPSKKMNQFGKRVEPGSEDFMIKFSNQFVILRLWPSSALVGEDVIVKVNLSKVKDVIRHSIFQLAGGIGVRPYINDSEADILHRRNELVYPGGNAARDIRISPFEKKTDIEHGSSFLWMQPSLLRGAAPF
jgi:hypothetical protein